MSFLEKIPLSLYVHIPWCVRKCPYCDFNSHAIKKEGSREEEYIDALIADFRQSLSLAQGRPLHSIFFGGGTPSLLKPESYARFLRIVFQEMDVENNVEITIEANPGTADEQYFKGYHEIGINRLSLGVQSFNVIHLMKLGRIHSAVEAKNAFYMAQSAGFDNVNLDLMFGLPSQTLEEALSDLKQAINLKPQHLSWYQLTLEPNTVFYKRPPVLPNEDKLWEIEEQGKQLIQEHYQQYEISAYSRPNQQCRHNVNYWLFGDYLGIGAGAHGKITFNHKIVRTQKKRQPEDYMNREKTFMAQEVEVSTKNIAFEFMLNALRLYQPIPYQLLTDRAFLSIEKIQKKLMEAQQKGLLTLEETSFEATILGHQYLNDLQEIFI